MEWFEKTDIFLSVKYIKNIINEFGKILRNIFKSLITNNKNKFTLSVNKIIFRNTNKLNK